MSELSEEITKEYFESKAYDTIDTKEVTFNNMDIGHNTDILRNLSSKYVNSRLIQYHINSKNIDDIYAYIHIESLLRDMINNNTTIKPKFYKNINGETKIIEKYDNKVFDSELKIENTPGIKFKTTKFQKKLKNRRKKHNLSIDKEIEIINCMLNNKYPVLKGQFKEPIQVNRYIVYPLYISNIDDSVHFEFNPNISDNETFESIVKHVGGSPEYIPSSEFYIAPHWKTKESIMSDKTKLWKLLSSSQVESNFQSLKEKLYETYKFW